MNISHDIGEIHNISERKQKKYKIVFIFVRPALRSGTSETLYKQDLRQG